MLSRILVPLRIIHAYCLGALTAIQFVGVSLNWWQFVLLMLLFVFTVADGIRTFRRGRP